ncbi:unnamed protein product [Amoebophrya sp. A120]|nr:unnamed protein product [Amoebophrya sp. A120]|eukprot:GSA120T00002339001.1
MADHYKRSRWGAEPNDPAAKRSRWGVEPSMPPPASQAGGAAQAALAAMAAMKQKQNLHDKIKEMKDKNAMNYGMGAAPKLIIDNMGRELDEDGKVIPMRAPQVATLKVNQRSRPGYNQGSVSSSSTADFPSRQLAAMNSGIASSMTGIGGASGIASYASGISSFAGGISSYAGSIAGPDTKAPVMAVNKQGQSVLHSAKHFDPKVRLRGAGLRDKRRMMGFSFVQDDKYIAQQEEKDKEEAQKAAAKALEEKNKKTEAGDGTGAKTGAQLIAMSTKAARAPPAPVPEHVEWWDALLLKKSDKAPAYDLDMIDERRVTNYVEHPVPIKPQTISLQKEMTVKPLESMLTPAERKKLRRRNRQERAQQMRDKIMMGVIEAPPPKVKFSNLMRVLGDEQIANPTAIEQKVKRETEQRRLDHERRNEAAKLDPEARKKKKQQRWDGNTIGGPAPKTDGRSSVNETHVLAFSIKDMKHGKHQFKVTVNAEQFQLSGVLIMCTGLANLLIVEGGKRAITKYRKLIMRRIKWDETAAGGEDEDDDDEDSDGGGGPAKKDDPATLMWQGTIQKRLFDGFKAHTIKTEAEGRQILASRGCESYWTMLESYRDANQDL